MTQQEIWHLHLGSHERGPMPTSEVIRGIKLGKVNKFAKVYTKRLDAWTPILDVEVFAPYLTGRAQTPQREAPARPARKREADGRVDYIISGEEIQYIELVLDPGESCFSESAGLIYMDPGVHITATQDGVREQGFFGALFGGYDKQYILEDSTLARYENLSNQPAKLALTSAEPGRVLAFDLGRSHESRPVFANSGAFFAASQGVKMQAVQGNGAWYDQAYFQHFCGQGTVFLQSGGALIHRTLRQGERLRTSSESLFALRGSIKQTKLMSGVNNTLSYAGLNALKLIELTGPLDVWFHTHSIRRSARHIKQVLEREHGADFSPRTMT